MRRLLAIWALLLGVVLSLGHVFAQPSMLPLLGAGKGAASGGGGGVTVDCGAGCWTYKYQGSSTTATIATNSVGAVSSPGLACAVVRADNTNDVSTGIGVTWNGVAMSLRTQKFGIAVSDYVFLFGLANPATGNHTLTMSATNSAADNFIGCVSFSGVNQSSDAAAFPNPVNANNSLDLSVTSAAGHYAVGVLCCSLFGTILGSTMFADTTSSAIVNAAADYVASSGSSTLVGSSTTSQRIIAGMDVSP